MKQTIEFTLKRPGLFGDYCNAAGYLGICNSFVDKLLGETPDKILVRLRAIKPTALQGKWRVGYVAGYCLVRIAGVEHCAYDLIRNTLSSLGLTVGDKFWFKITAI